MQIEVHKVYLAYVRGTQGTDTVELKVHLANVRGTYGVK